MKKCLFFVIGIASWLAGCKPRLIERPAGVLDRAKMVAVQMGVHQLESEYSLRRLPYEEGKRLYDMAFDSLCRANQVDTHAYRRSYQWYSANIGEMDKVYEAVIDSLGVLESRAKRGG